MTRGEDHDADHVAIRPAFERWDYDPEAQLEILRDTVILHLGAFHGWNVHGHGEVLGLAPMLASHDSDHRSRDALALEASLDQRVVEAIRLQKS